MMGSSLKKASITVETAFALPLFIIFSMQLLSVFEMMTMYCRLQKALQETTAEVAMFLYVSDDPEQSKETSLLLSETFVREEIIRKAGMERINNSVISGGTLGLHLFRSDVATNGSDVNLVLTYRVEPWFSFRGIGGMTLVNRCSIKAWNGFEKEEADSGEEEDEQTVYVTRTGVAYHLYSDCTYIKADSHMVTKEELFFARNEDGEKYYPCEFCSKNNSSDCEDYYVSTYGNRYHTDSSCKALVKDVEAISLQDVGNRHLCSKCAKRSGE